MYPKKSVYETANDFVTQILFLYFFIYLVLSLTSVYLFIIGAEGYCCPPITFSEKDALGRTPLDEGSACR